MGRDHPDHGGGRGPVTGSDSSRADTTRTAVLAAAQTLFCERGYEATTINEIVARSGVSVGSVYHHFGGKAEVFMALARLAFSTHARASASAAGAARRRGGLDETELYLVGARAFVVHMLEDRATARFLMGDDTPPGFADHRRDAHRAFLRGAEGVVLMYPPVPGASAHAVTSLILAAVLHVIHIDEDERALAVLDYFLDLVRHLAAASR